MGALRKANICDRLMILKIYEVIMAFFKNLKWGLLPTIMALAWPTVVEQFMQTAVQYIDTAMVGSLGREAVAAVGSTTTINWLVNGTVSAIGVGFLSFIAQSMGAKDINKAKRASAQAVFVCAVVGIFFTVLTTSLSGAVPVLMRVDKPIRNMAAEYFLILYAPMLFRTAMLIFGTVLRAAGDTKSPMVIGIAVNIINVVLNFFFIYETRTVMLFGKEITVFGAGMGVSGAALASTVAFTVGGIAITVMLFAHKEISPLGYKILPDLNILRPCLKIGFPNMLQRFGTYLGYVVFAAMINSLGDMATATNTIASTVESAFYIPAYGMQTAAATLAGNALGANDRQQMRDFSRVILTLEILLMIVSGGLLFAFAEPMMDIFTDDSEVIALGTTVLRMVALSEPVFGAAIILEGMMLGVGNTVVPFIYNIICMWGVRIVGTFICVEFLHMGLVSAWACMIAHNIVLFVLFLFRYIGGKWNPLE